MADAANEAPEQAAEPAGVPAPASLPETAKALAATADDLVAIRTAVVEAAGVSGPLWLSYLFALFYLLVASGAVTHKDLFLENPVKLPFLGIDLPLKAFFWLGPALFLILHMYVLLHFVLLSGKIATFNAELVKQIPDWETRRDVRGQLPTNIFVQFLAGPREVRRGFVGLLLWLIALITLVIAPVALLMFFELQFLPYHHATITWWQRIAVAIDLLLVWRFWPAAALGARLQVDTSDGTREPAVVRLQRSATIVAMQLLTLIALPLMFAVATFPGEWLDRQWPALPVIPEYAKDANTGTARWRSVSVSQLLIAGKTDGIARRPRSLWSNVLVLPGFGLIEDTKFDTETKIESVRTTLALRSRHLEGAVLTDASLKKADLTGAQLQGASLFRAQLQGASLDFTQLQGASLDGAQLQSASLDRAQLQSASLDRAQLQSASLDRAQLQSASLYGAQLQSASLYGAQLQGASLEVAQLQGASLTGAELQDASLYGAQLQGASLTGAELQGASLDGAQLQGALLDFAQLQGASLTGAELQGASLWHTSVWRTDPDKAEWRGARMVRFEPGPSVQPIPIIEAGLSREEFGELLRSVDTNVPEGLYRTVARQRLAILDPANDDQEAERVRARAWDQLQSESPTKDMYQDGLVTILKNVGCSADGAPYVVNRIAQTANFRLDHRHGAALAAAFLAPDCDGAHGISDETRAILVELRGPVPPPAAPGPTPKEPTTGPAISARPQTTP